MTPEEEEQQRIQQEFTKKLLRILSEEPKKFANNVELYFGEGHFALVVSPGGTPETYTLTPHIAKRLMRVFVNHVSNYEKTFGEIRVDVSIPSPIQMADIQDAGDKPSSDEDSEDSPDSGESAPPKKPKKGK